MRFFSLAVISLGLSCSTLVLATPPPDMIDALEAAKQRDHHIKRSHGKGELEKKWVVLPSSDLPEHLKQGRPNSAPVTEKRIRRIVKRDEASSANTTAAPAATPASSVAPTSTSASADLLNPFDWPQAAQDEYHSKLDEFNRMDILSKVGLGAIVLVGVILLLSILICTCKIKRARNRRRKEKLRLKAEAAQIAQLYRSNTAASARTTNSSSTTNSEKKGGMFGWMKKNDAPSMRETHQNRAQSWDARARGLDSSRGGQIPEAHKASGGSMKSRTRSWAM
ncbi:uncharacterized protein JCM15063_001822 [Sporobolomyces koalae]|uniref:uncharacterized protein n=1 Tax=Sporobolomyces koalae TaxID=500713 RepID=UPI0031710FCD